MKLAECKHIQPIATCSQVQVLLGYRKHDPYPHLPYPYLGPTQVDQTPDNHYSWCPSSGVSTLAATVIPLMLLKVPLLLVLKYHFFCCWVTTSLVEIQCTVRMSLLCFNSLMHTPVSLHKLFFKRVNVVH